MKSSPTTAPEGAIRKVAASIKLAYGFGDIGSNIFIVTSGFFLLFFLTNVVGVNPPWRASPCSSLLWTWYPIPSWAPSRPYAPRWGRRRPYLFGALPFGLTFLAIFVVPGTSPSRRALHAALMFALGCGLHRGQRALFEHGGRDVRRLQRAHVHHLVPHDRLVHRGAPGWRARHAAGRDGGGGADGFRFMGRYSARPSRSSRWCAFSARAGLERFRSPVIRWRANSSASRSKIVPSPFSELHASVDRHRRADGGLIYFIKHVMMLPRPPWAWCFPYFRHGDRLHPGG